MSCHEMIDNKVNEQQRSPINLHHVHIFASDIDASLKFYAKWFGAKVIWDGVFANARNIFVQIGGGHLHFYDQPPRGHGKNAYHHIGIQIDDLDSLYNRMKEEGFPLRQEVKHSTDGSYLMVEAPDGVLLELFQPPPDHRKRTGTYFF